MVNVPDFDTRTLLSAQRLIVESIAPSLTAPGGVRGLNRPILVVSSRPGTGLGTALARTVDAFRNSPCARISIDRNRPTDLPGVVPLLTEAVGRLRAHRAARRVGLKFTAFDVCFALLTSKELDLDGPNPKAAVNRFLRELFFLRLRSIEDRTRQMATDIPSLPAWAGVLLGTVDVPLRGMFFPSYNAWRRRLNRILRDCRSFQESDPVDQLVRLWAADKADDTTTVDRLMCEVLLADLSDQHVTDSPAPLLLLDGVRLDDDMSLSSRLLHGFADAHALHGDQPGWGPLAVIAGAVGVTETLTLTADTTIEDILSNWNRKTTEIGDAGNASKWIIHIDYPGLRPDDIRKLVGRGHSGSIGTEKVDWVLRIADDQVVDATVLIRSITHTKKTQSAVVGDPEGIAALTEVLSADNADLADRVRIGPDTSGRLDPEMKSGVRHPHVDRLGIYRPPPSRRLRRRFITRMVTVVAMLIAAGFVSAPYIDQYFGSCEGDIEIARIGEECIGVTDGSFVFGATFARLSRLIHTENERVVEETDPRHIVTIAYLAPIDENTEKSMRHQLEGAYLAQREANQVSLNQRRTMIRLLIANSGTRGRQWPTVVEDLVSRKDTAPDNLIAVAGLGSSYSPTFAAMRELSTHGIPMVGSVITADGVIDDISSAFRVAPDNTDEARAVVDYLHADDDVSTAMLIRDTNPDDTYARTLAEAFADLFPGDGTAIVADQVYDSSYVGVVESFANMVGNICFVKPDVVFFAGRGVRDLPDLVTQLADRNCRSTPLRIVTGDDASHFPDLPKIRSIVAEANVSIEYAGLAHPSQWMGDVDTGSLPEDERARHAFAMRGFVEEYTEAFGTANNLTDGQTIMAYDAVTLTIEAIRLFDMDHPKAGALSNALPQLVGCIAAYGLTGRLAVSAEGDADNKAIPILAFDHNGPPRVVSVVWPKREPTQIPNDC